jgi:beta-phosphoglucomutase
MTRPGRAAPGSLLFDLDGTMVDTDHLHLEAWNAALSARGRPALTAGFYRRRIMGQPNAAITPQLLPDAPAEERLALAEDKEARFRARLGTDPLSPLPGLRALLDAADREGLGMAVVTNAPRPNAEAMLRGLGLERRFPVLVIGEELPRPKPDPMPYATALARLGRVAAHAVAFEDSASGLAAARGAGAFTIGIGTTLGAAALRDAGTQLAIADFRAPALARLLAERLGLDLT